MPVTENLGDGPKRAQHRREFHLSLVYLVVLVQISGFARLFVLSSQFGADALWAGWPRMGGLNIVSSSMHAGALLAAGSRWGYCRRRTGRGQGKRAVSRILYLVSRATAGWRRDAVGHSTPHVYALLFTLDT